jgi:predicted metal-binding membrane protein
VDKLIVSAGVFLFLAGVVGVYYGAGVNLQGMMARGASDYSFITAYITEWVLVLIAGLVLIVAGLRRK